MKKLFLIIIIIAFLYPVSGYAAPGVDTTRFDLVISSVTGDLNNDNIHDSAVVLQDTLNENGPHLLQIFFADPDGIYQLYLQTDSAIEVQYPNGRNGFSTGSSFSGLSIKNTVLSLNTQLLRGHYVYKFRFQNNAFELIGFSESYSDGKGILNSSDYNLSTGLLIEKVERYDINKVISRKQQVIKVNPLPRLQNFTPFSTDLY